MKFDTSILLATYNSSTFLDEQLESLFLQTDRNWNLIIRDDGSSDNTLDIIEKFKSKYPNISLLEDNKKGLGAMKSFLELLKQTESPYYFFCDHDDIWLPNKIENTRKKMKELELYNNNLPLIIHTDLKVVDEKLNFIHQSFWSLSGIKPDILEQKNYIQVFNCVTGCTMMFNHLVKKLAFPFPDNTPMHDWWLSIKTVEGGGIIKHLEDQTILYRQHSSNVVGARKIDFLYFIKKLYSLKETFAGHQLHLQFLKEINGLNVFKYYFYKLIYTVMRNKR